MKPASSILCIASSASFPPPRKISRLDSPSERTASPFIGRAASVHGSSKPRAICRHGRTMANPPPAGTARCQPSASRSFYRITDLNSDGHLRPVLRACADRPGGIRRPARAAPAQIAPVVLQNQRRAAYVSVVHGGGLLPQTHRALSASRRRSGAHVDRSRWRTSAPWPFHPVSA